MDECKPLLEGQCYLHADVSVKPVSRMEVKVLEYRAAEEPGRGLHSSTIQLNLSRFCQASPRPPV